MENVFIVIGATGSVGSALVKKYQADNTPVIAVARNQQLLDEQFADIATALLDVTDYQATHELFAKLAKEYSVQGVALCVGNIMLKPASMLKIEEWQETLNLNLNTAFNVVSAVAKHVKQDAAVVLFSSAAASIGLANHEAIAAAKAGVEGLARSASASYASKNLRFNVIAPGLTESKMSKVLFDNERAIAVSKKMHPLGRLGEPEKLANLAFWLMTPDNDWITGEVIHCDGGLATLKLPG